MAPISLTVKLLSDKKECNIEIDDTSTSAQLKENLEPLLGVSSYRQKLVYNGKPLIGDQTLSSQGIINGARLHVIIQKSSLEMDTRLTRALHQFLRPHFTEPDCKAIMELFDQKLTRAVEDVSLEDIERLASVWKK